MTPEKWKKIKIIFTDAQDVPVDQRPRFLERVCENDQKLKREVEKLLDSYDENDPFLENSAVAEVASIFNNEKNRGEDLAEMEFPQFHAGELLNQRYEVIRLLGKGGMGAVYLANDTKISRDVSVKVLHSDVASNKERLRRFVQEARAVSALNHPHIMTVYEFGKTDEEIHFIVGEFVDGKTLNQYRVGENLSVSEILDIAIQVASALSTAHEAGIIHRDIKPENIMVRQDGYIKVLDFGLAKLTRQSPSTVSFSEEPTRELNTTSPGSIMGTASYMSPEQARGIQVDARTDIWSLGVVVYEMLTGKRPFSGETPADILVTVLREEPFPLNSYIDGLPPELEWIVAKTLSKKVEGRYQTSNELRADLEKIKKQIEFDEELHRSTGNSFRNDEIKENGKNRKASTSVARTLSGFANPTIEGIEKTNEAPVSWSSPSVEYVFKQAKSHRIGSAVVALILVALISSAFYYAFIAPRSSEQIDSIAVLPFENLSGNREITYLSDGVSESLINQLSQLPQLKVISRNSSFKFRDENPDLPDIASKLGVRAIVTGSVTQTGDELMIKFEIVDAAENKHLLGGQYNRKAGDLLEIQNEIAQAISDQLRLKLTDFQSKRIANNGTENSEAFRYYLSGLVELHGPQNIRGKSLEYFQKAVELDPDFAEAHTEIAWIYWSHANASGNPKELIPKVKAETEKALAIDPNLAKAHVLLATLKENEFDWQTAEEEYRRAIELNPNLDFTRNNYAYFLSVMGRQTEALAELEQVRERDPINMLQWLKQKGLILTLARRFDEALQAYQEAQALDQTVKVENFALGYVYGGKGLYKEAAVHFKRSVEIVGGDDEYSIALVFLAASYAKIPEKQAEARAILTRLESMDSYVSPATLAIVYAALNENDKAMAALEKAYIDRDLQLRFIGVGYEYDSLRNDPRFADLIKRIGLH